MSTDGQPNTILSIYTPFAWVQEVGAYLNSSALAGYATEAWVISQNYITSSALAGYATEAWVISQNYITSSALVGYLTQTQGNSLYLRKTTTDTTSFLQNFNGGIRTTVGTSRTNFTEYGLDCDDNYSSYVTGLLTSVSPGVILCSDRSDNSQAYLNKGLLFMDSNTMSLAGKQISMTNNSTDCKLELSNKNGNIKSTLSNDSIVFSTASQSGTVGFNGISTPSLALTATSATTGDITLTSGTGKKIKVGSTVAASLIDIGTTNSVTTIGGDLKANNIIGGGASTQMNIGGDLGGGNVTMGANLGTSGRLNFGSAVAITNCFGTLRSSVIEPLSTVTGIAIGGGQTASGEFIRIGGNAARTGDIEIGKSMTAGAINIGTAISGTSTLNIGNVSRPTSSAGSYILDTIPLTNGSARNMEIRYGSATNVPSLSYMFCRKNTGTLTTLTTFAIGAPTDQSCEFFEIIVTGSNQDYGPYSYKGCFGVSKQGITMSATAVTSIFAFNGTPAITFTALSPFGMNMEIDCSFGSSSNQNFIATLICYPSTSPTDFTSLYYDYDVTPIA
jgi:hypothetical protein